MGLMICILWFFVLVSVIGWVILVVCVAKIIRVGVPLPLIVIITPPQVRVVPPSRVVSFGEWVLVW